MYFELLAKEYKQVASDESDSDDSVIDISAAVAGLKRKSIDSFK